MLKLIRASDAPSMPWKNGGGSTVELACWPPGSGLGDFDWRISVASIERDGPFSAFAGIERTLILLDGAGMLLRWAERSQRVEAAHPRIDFAGEPGPDCRLLAGPTRDFNLMWRADLGPASLEVLPLRGVWSGTAHPGQRLALYLRSGWASSAAGPLQAGDLLHGEALAVDGQGEAWLMQLPQRTPA